jgi:hypothetical protein
VGRGKTLIVVSITLLPLWIGLIVGGVLFARSHQAKPSPWTSRARFTVSHVGSYTAADATVPIGIHGNAEIDLGMGLSGNRQDFLATIGDDPNDDTNVSRWELDFDGYHGVGTYTMAAGSGEMTVTVRNLEGRTDTWQLEHSKAAACAIRVTADTAMKDPTIHRIRGSVTCHALYDENRRTANTVLSSTFDVFAEIWCGGHQDTQPCRPPQPFPNPPVD